MMALDWLMKDRAFFSTGQQFLLTFFKKICDFSHKKKASIDFSLDKEEYLFYIPCDP